MEYSDYSSKKELYYRLSVIYNDTFEVLNAPESQNRFTAKEKATFDYIKNNHRIEIKDPFSVVTWQTGTPDSEQPLAFDFHATPDEILESSKSVTDFTSAHEIKHASLAYNQYVNGVINIHSLVVGTKKIFERINQFQNSNPELSFLTKPLAYGVKLTHSAFHRQEERICDRFALRVYPNADLQEQKAFTQKSEAKLMFGEPNNITSIENPVDGGQKYSGKLEFAIENLKEICSKYERSHPENDSRYNLLSIIQSKRKF